MFPFCEIEDLGWQVNAQTSRPTPKKNKPPRFPPFPPFTGGLVALLSKKATVSPLLERHFANVMIFETATH